MRQKLKQSVLDRGEIQGCGSTRKLMLFFFFFFFSTEACKPILKVT